MRLLTGAIVLALTALPASADPLEDVHIGPAVPISVPGTYSADVAFEISGSLNWQVGLIIEEFAGPIPRQRVDVLVNDEPVAATISGDDGSWSVMLTFPPSLPTTRAVRAVAFAGTPLETSSRTEHTHIDHYVIDLWIEPGSAALAVGGQIQLVARGELDRGSPVVLTDRAAWSSSNTAVATVGNGTGNKGLVNAVTAGSATITATYGDHTATATISVS